MILLEAVSKSLTKKFDEEIVAHKIPSDEHYCLSFVNLVRIQKMIYGVLD